MYQTLHIAVCLCILCLSTADVAVTGSIHYLENGPVVQLSCMLNTNGSTTNPTYTWILRNKTLAVNGTLTAQADPTRHSIHFWGSSLQIVNAIKADEGEYQCQVDYYLSGSFQTENGSKTVDKIPYLPAPDYPKCTIKSSTSSLLDRSDTLFQCEVGHSSPSVKVNLTLERQDGSIRQLGNTSVTGTITLKDDGAMFVCHMTSDTFPTAYRNCSAGPLAIVESSSNPSTTSGSPIPSSSPPPSSLMTSSSSPSSKMVANASSSNILLWSLVGSLLASFVILLIVALTINRIQHIRTAKAGNTNLTISPWKSDIRDTSKTHSSKPPENQCSNGARQTPIYAVVHKESSFSRDSVKSLDTFV